MIGLRYTRAKRRNRFISFISLISMGGIALGVAVLIVVLSVMNGFQTEVRTRILGVASHLVLTGPGNSLSDWEAVVRLATEHPRVVAAAPFVQAQAMLTGEGTARGVAVRGVLPQAEDKVADFSQHMVSGRVDALQPGAFGIVLVNLEDAQRLYQHDHRVSGVRLKLVDLFESRKVGRELVEKSPELFGYDWTSSNPNLFRAVQIEKRMMFIILTLIVAVATFNVVSTLVMLVTDKQADIAILRTLGAAPGS